MVDKRAKRPEGLAARQIVIVYGMGTGKRGKGPFSTHPQIGPEGSLMPSYLTIYSTCLPPLV